MLNALPGQTIAVSVEMTIVECATCAMPWGMPARFVTDRRADRGTFYCPLGHKNTYGPTPKDEEIAKLKAALAKAEQEVKQAKATPVDHRPAFARRRMRNPPTPGTAMHKVMEHARTNPGKSATEIASETGVCNAPSFLSTLTNAGFLSSRMGPDSRLRFHPPAA